jgi:hypothetical protein
MQVILNILFAQAWLTDAKGENFLIAGTRAANNGGLVNGCVFGQHGLDLGRIDVETRADDQLFEAANDMNGAVAILAGQIAGAKVAVLADRGAGRLFIMVVALHHIGRADQQFADASLVLIGDLDLDPGEGRSNGDILSQCFNGRANNAGGCFRPSRRPKRYSAGAARWGARLDH